MQAIVEAEYAFVLHTVNPTTSDASEMYGEIVVGQGESLVGNAPGRAFGFTCQKTDEAEPVVKSLPSKGAALWGSGWIFRSDSNAEDLPGFAGAGLFDSFPVVQHATSLVSYRNEKLVGDPQFARGLMLSLKDLARRRWAACRRTSRAASVKAAYTLSRLVRRSASTNTAWHSATQTHRSRLYRSWLYRDLVPDSSLVEKT